MMRHGPLVTMGGLGIDRTYRIVWSLDAEERDERKKQQKNYAQSAWMAGKNGKK